MPECVILAEAERLWDFCPSYGAAITFLIIYSASTLVHGIQGIIYRKPFTIVLIMGGIWELSGFALRVSAILNPYSGAFHSSMGILILLAPLWINAFVYMALGRLIHFTLVHDKILRLRARHLTVMFVAFDITAFIMQASGGILAAKSDNRSTKIAGYNLYSAGVGIQMGFILWFVALVLRFHFKLRRPDTYELSGDGRAALPAVKRIIYALYAVLVLILYRNSWRLAEYATGVDSALRLHEWWFYVFDALPMAGALTLLNIFNPISVLRGPRGEFSGGKKLPPQGTGRRRRKRADAHEYTEAQDSESLPLSSRSLPGARQSAEDRTGGYH
ncbi:hypothetical protein LTR84_003314 [Exophiala bonariae]|uniref:RTA1 domain protein n=1 Tax=Exophiala bonariae TaxID=1690606 RepID=A0AAV9N7G4_9EURO|nr:hypothetical protein LTR84_003314 [Exophiala bonariae]